MFKKKKKEISVFMEIEYLLKRYSGDEDIYGYVLKYLDAFMYRPIEEALYYENLIHELYEIESKRA